MISRQSEVSVKKCREINFVRIRGKGEETGMCRINSVESKLLSLSVYPLFGTTRTAAERRQEM